MKSVVPRFAAACLIWGFSFLFIKVGGEALAPLQISLGRMVAGAAVLLAVLWFRGERLPRGWRTWGHLAVAALFLNALPYTLFAIAEQRISSSLAGICNAATPLFTVLVSLLVFRAESFGPRRLAGLVLGFAGVLVVLGAWRGVDAHDRSGTLMAVAAAFCYGLGGPYARRYLAGTGTSSLSVAAGQLLLATVQLALIAPWLTTLPGAVPLRSALAVLALGTMGTGIAGLLYFSIIRDAGATVASTMTYVIPVISTVAGVALLGERLSWNEPAGAAIILGGALFARSQAPAPVEAKPAIE